MEKLLELLKKILVGCNVGDFPKLPSLGIRILKIRRLAQIQVAEELLDGWDFKNRTLQSDANSKYG